LIYKIEQLNGSTNLSTIKLKIFKYNKPIIKLHNTPSMSADILGARIISANKALAAEKAQNGDTRVEKVAYLLTEIQILETFQASGAGFESEEKLEEELKKVLSEKKKELRKKKDEEKKAGKAAKQKAAADAQAEEDKKDEETAQSMSPEEKEKIEKAEREAYEKMLELEKEEERKKKQSEHDELKRRAEGLMQKANDLLRELTEKNVPHSDDRWNLYVRLSEKASIADLESKEAEFKPDLVVDPLKAKKQHLVFQMESRSLRYNEALASYKSLFTVFKYSKSIDLNEDAEDYYEKLTESYNQKIGDLKSLKELLSKMMTESDIFQKENFLFNFDDGSAIAAIIDKLKKHIKLMKKIDELDEKLTAAGLDECEEYSEEEYQKKLKELQTV